MQDEEEAKEHQQLSGGDGQVESEEKPTIMELNKPVQPMWTDAPKQANMIKELNQIDPPNHIGNEDDMSEVIQQPL